MRFQVKQLGITAVVTQAVFACFMFAVHSEAQEPERHRERPAWINEGPVILAFQSCDAILMTRRSGRGPRTWYKEDYDSWKSDDQVRRWKEQGITLAILNFYRGFGLETEKEQIQATIKQAEVCRQYGIRVGVYIGDTIFYETFFSERPEAKDWLVPDFRGTPVIYGGTEHYRRRPYIGHPEYVKFIKEVIRIAVEDLKADLIHFDNTCNQVRSPNMFHPIAKQEFRDFLKNKYTPEERVERWGFSDVTYIEPPIFLDVFAPPVYMVAPEPIDDPIFQEWLDFRCQRLTDHYAELESYIKELNPEVSVEMNPHGVTGYVNKTFYEGVDWPRLLAHSDFFWSEHERSAGVTDDGILTSKIRSYKVARILDNMLFSGSDRLGQCEALAFNQHCVLAVDQIAHYLHRNFEYFRGTETIADVAILRSYASIAHSTKETRYSTILFEQTLIQRQIPFDIIFNDNLKDLSKYAVLVLADQESLSDEQISLIRDYVNQGGGLVATGNTSLFTEWRRQRRAFGLSDVFGILNPGQAGEKIRRIQGDGRVVYIPAVQPGVDESVLKPRWTEYWKFPIEYWTLPRNADALVDAITWASKDKMSLDVEAPETVVIELLQQKEENRLLLHVINYDYRRNPLLEDIQVKLRLPKNHKVDSMFMLSPDHEQPTTLQCGIEENLARIKIPRLEMYEMVVVQLAGS
ncbi:MAG: hypothetical protein ABIH23_21350 [bacterium]